MTPSDAEILAELKGGNPAALGLLIDRYRPRLLRFAARSTGDAAIAEDLVQETFAAVHSACGSYDEHFAVSTWIWTILLNLCRRHRRGELSRQRTRKRWLAAAPSSVQPDTALEELVRDEESRRLRTLLAELPAPQADALRLRFFAELSFDEIADAMNSSVSGAKVRVRKGLLALSERIRRDEAHETAQPSSGPRADEVLP